MFTIIVFRCDAWHSHASMYVIGVCSNLDSVFRLIDAYNASISDPLLSAQSKQEIKDFGQTQSHEGNYEFMLETFKLDTVDSFLPNK